MRILIIEDEKEIASFVMSGLKAENFAVDWASDAEKGLWLARTNDYDLIILDIKLAGKDGKEICKTLRKDEKDLPIIMLSVKNETSIKVKALNCGADDYLTKPFSFEELFARVKALLRRERKIVATILKVGDLIVDLNARRVERDGKPIHLNKKEFSLLEYLIRNTGSVLTRAMILEHVWDMNTDPFTNTVDVHVRFLRQKIDDP